MLEAIQSALAQIDLAYFGDVLVSAVFLMGLNGIVLGIIAWTLTEKHGNALMLMMLGAGVGLFVGILVEGGQILLQFGSLQGIYENVGRISNQAFEVFLGIMSWTFAGMAFGGLISSFSRALMGAVLGAFAGVIAGVIMILVRQEFGLNLSDTLLVFGATLVTLGLLVVMGYGQN